MSRTAQTARPARSSRAVGTASAVDPARPVETLRTAVNQLLAADRRLRGRDHSRPGELTFAQLRTVAALGRGHEMTAGQLAKSAELTPATITTILDQLESADIVERRRSSEDRRVCNVALTPQGWELLERKLAAWQALWSETLAGFTEQDLETATRVLHELTGMLDTLANSLDAAQSGEQATA